jgi:hypothetical protein
MLSLALRNLRLSVKWASDPAPRDFASSTILSYTIRFSLSHKKEGELGFSSLDAREWNGGGDLDLYPLSFTFSLILPH